MSLLHRLPPVLSQLPIRRGEGSGNVRLSDITPPVSAGQGEAAGAPACTLSSGSCPAMCSCSSGIVDCRGKGLTAIPANLPETMTEM